MSDCPEVTLIASGPHWFCSSGVWCDPYNCDRMRAAQWDGCEVLALIRERQRLEARVLELEAELAKPEAGYDSRRVIMGLQERVRELEALPRVPEGWGIVDEHRQWRMELSLGFWCLYQRDRGNWKWIATYRTIPEAIAAAQEAATDD